MHAPAAHHDALLVRGRCGRCAEVVDRRKLLRKLDCNHCGAPLAPKGRHDLPTRLEQGRWRWRLLGYSLVAVASFAAGLIPLAQSLVQIVAIFVLHVVLLRRPMQWLTPARRMTTRFTVKILGAFIGAVGMLVNVAVAPLPGVSAVVLAVVGFALTAVYVETGLAVVRRRLLWEAQGMGLRVVEWALPASLVLALLVSTLGTLGLAAGSLHLLASADIPTVSDLAAWLLQLGD